MNEINEIHISKSEIRTGLADPPQGEMYLRLRFYFPVGCGVAGLLAARPPRDASGSNRGVARAMNQKLSQ